jgi:hypothetical protein
MKKTIEKIQYESPSIETVELVLEGSILEGSGDAGGDAGGEDGWG